MSILLVYSYLALKVNNMSYNIFFLKTIISHAIYLTYLYIYIDLFEVTIFYIQETVDEVYDDEKHEQLKVDTEKMILSKIFSRFPIDGTFLQRAKETLTVIVLEWSECNNIIQDTKIENYHCQNHNRINAGHPLQKCEIERGPCIFDLLQQNVVKYVKNDREENTDFVMMMDASFLGGLLYSDINAIPTIAIGSIASWELMVEHDPKWTPSQKDSILNRLKKVMRQRLQSLGLTRVFLQAKKMRQSLGVETESFRTPFDCFSSVEALFVDFESDDDKHKPVSKGNYKSEDGGGDEHEFNNRVRYIHPFLSPCMPCLKQPVSVKDERNAPVIMVAIPEERSDGIWIRSLIRVLSFVRQSLQEYDECLFDRASCRNRVAKFEVNWLKMTENEKGGNANFFPPVFPSFITSTDSNSVLDSAISNPKTIVAIISCDSESKLLSSFGIEVFCISQSGSNDLNKRDPLHQMLQNSLNQATLDSEVVAIQLLKVLRRKSIDLSKHTRGTLQSFDKRNRKAARQLTGGLLKTLLIVEETAQMNRGNQINLKNSGFREPLHDASTVLIAWLILLFAALYVFMKHILLISWLRDHNRRYHSPSLLNGILLNLAELDDAWRALLDFSKDVTKPFDVYNDEHAAGSIENDHVLQNQSKVRRRRKIKATR